MGSHLETWQHKRNKNINGMYKNIIREAANNMNLKSEDRAIFIQNYRGSFLHFTAPMFQRLMETITITNKAFK